MLTPLPGQEAIGYTRKSAETGPASSRRPGILVVDDESMVRTMLQRVLQEQGFSVWLAASGLDALQLYQQQRPDIDLVLLAVRMPGLDGPQTLDSLQRVNPAIRCCFMGGGNGHYNAEDLRRRGALHLFAKPFDPDIAAVLWQLTANGEPAAGATQAGRSEPLGPIAAASKNGDS